MLQHETRKYNSGKCLLAARGTCLQNEVLVAFTSCPNDWILLTAAMCCPPSTVLSEMQVMHFLLFNTSPTGKKCAGIITANIN